MKTAIEEAIEEFEILKSKSSKLQDIVYLDGVISVLISKLPKEREQIEDAFNNGLSNWYNTDDLTGKEYYETTFKK